MLLQAVLLLGSTLVTSPVASWAIPSDSITPRGCVTSLSRFEIAIIEVAKRNVIKVCSMFYLNCSRLTHPSTAYMWSIGCSRTRPQERRSQRRSRTYRMHCRKLPVPIRWTPSSRHDLLQRLVRLWRPLNSQRRFDLL